MSVVEAGWLGDGVNTAGLSGPPALHAGPRRVRRASPRRDGHLGAGGAELRARRPTLCATTDEVTAALATVNVVAFTTPSIPVPLPVHLVFHDDRTCVVAEFRPEGMTVVDNPVQVATNAPYLDWHLTNVSNYLALSPSNPDPVNIGGTTFAPAGQGQGVPRAPGRRELPVPVPPGARRRALRPEPRRTAGPPSWTPSASCTASTSSRGR